jgi:hypothetical protein
VFLVLSFEDLDERFDHHPPKDAATVERHELVRRLVKELAYTFNQTVPTSRELAFALTALEQAMMWANAGIARNQ